MKKGLAYSALAATLVASLVVLLMAGPADAELRRVTVRLATGEVVKVTVDVPPGTSAEAVEVPGLPGAKVIDLGAPVTSAPAPKADEPAGDNDSGAQDGVKEKVDKGKKQTERGTGKAKDRKKRASKKKGNARSKAEGRRRSAGGLKAPAKPRLRTRGGAPTRSNPGFFEATPGPASITGVPNFAIRQFQVPIFLLPIYQAAGIEYGIRWEVLASINKIETNFGRNLNVSSAGALGWMQFMPATWRQYGVDGNKDGRKDPYNPVDAIFAAARYLKASGGDTNLKKAIFAYNRADWYVDMVMVQARLIAGYPPELVGSLTGLTEARFPVYAKARYADDLDEKDFRKKFRRGQNAANVIEDRADRDGIEIFARKGAPVIAVNDGVIRKVGRSKRLGRYIVLEDVYGNRFTYARLGRVSKLYPVPKGDAGNKEGATKTVFATPRKDPKPTRPASAGRQPKDTRSASELFTDQGTASPESVSKERLFAHPNRPNARAAGGIDQLLAGKLDGFTTFRNYFSRAFGLDAKNVRLKRLRKGARVIGGTILGRVGRPEPAKASYMRFEIRPVGRGAPRVDPKPILDGWKLLEATAIYRASGRNALRGDDKSSVGQILLLPKTLLERRILNDERIKIHPCGRTDIRTGQIDRRVLVSIAYLAESGLVPTVTSLKCGRTGLTSSGRVSAHNSGNAVDIAALNGVSVTGRQERGGITDQAVRRLMLLQGNVEPAQIISLIDRGANTLAMSDHADHIHVGFQPLIGDKGGGSLKVLKAGQWNDLVKRLGQIDNPVVPRRPSKYSLPARGRGR